MIPETTVDKSLRKMLCFLKINTTVERVRNFQQSCLKLDKFSSTVRVSVLCDDLGSLKQKAC